MKGLLGFIILWGFLSFQASAQIILDNSLTPEQLIEEVLVSEDIDVFGVTVSGIPNTQVRRFVDDDSYFGFSEGIYMTSGRANDLNFPATFTADATVNFPNGDPDIATLLRGNPNDVHDAMSITFSFIPNGDSVTFNYVFASEEYPDYVCSEFNDAFGFFLSGPGINGPFLNNAENLALIPGTGTPVAINTVNNGVVGIGAFPPVPSCQTGNTQYFINNTVGSVPPISQAQPVVYNGWTTKLTARSAVQCGEIYTIKMVIADFLDGQFDSGVFLEANSFNSTNIGLELSGIAADPCNLEVFEGCPVELLFSRPEAELNDTTTVNLSWAGTATAGTDYAGVIDSLYFLPGDDTLRYTLDIFPDDLAEGQEFIDVSIVTSACGGAGFTFSIAINDPLPLDLGIADTVFIACDETIRLDPMASGGTSNLNFEWRDPDGNIINTGPLTSPLTLLDLGTYTIQINDICSGDTLSKTVQLDQLRIQGTADFQVLNPVNCLGDSVVIQNSSSDFNTFAWNIDGGTIQSTEDLIFQPVTSGTYTITLYGSDSIGCFFPDSFSAPVTVYDSAFAWFETDPEYCLSTVVSLTAESYPFNESLDWSTSDGQSGSSAVFNPLFSNSGILDVQLEVATSDGCTDMITRPLMVSDSVDVRADFTLTSNRFCLGETVTPTNTSIDATDYVWSVNNALTSTDENPALTFPTTGSYTIELEASNQTLCSNPDQASQTIDVEVVTASYMTDTLCQFQPHVFMAGSNTFSTSYEWYVDGNLQGSSQQFTPTFSTLGIYDIELVVTSDIGCTDAISYPIDVREQAVPDFNYGPICAGEFTNFENLTTGDVDGYSWDFDDGLITTAIDPVHLFQEGRVYNVTLQVFSDHCPTTSVTIPIQGYEVVDIDLGDQLFLCAGETQVLAITEEDANLLDTWFWNDSIFTETFDATIDIPEVILTTVVGTCSKSSSVEIMESCSVFFPSSFTPNGDGLNDYFNIIPENVSEFTLTIFDRWGTALFTTSDFDFGWDGMLNGSEAPIDTYVYFATGTRRDGRPFRVNGSVAVIR